MSAAMPLGSPRAVAGVNRWIQLFFGIVCMAMVANLQYGWTLFVNPMEAKYHWGRAAIQVAFSIFVITETWLVPIEGYLVDRFGPRPVVMAGGVLRRHRLGDERLCRIARRALFRRGRRRRRRQVRSTALASATHSSGSPIGAASRPA